MTDKASLEIVISKESGYADAVGTAKESAKVALDALGELLTSAVEPFQEKLRKGADSADEIELKLDLALRGEGKWIVVSMGASATVSVKLLWKKQSVE